MIKKINEIKLEDSDKDDLILQKIEWGDMWDNLNSDIKQHIS